MGVVYQGYDPLIGRKVAIKTMLTEGLSEQEFSEYKTRFQREAQAAGTLAHPNIITVYDFGEQNGVLYLAMEYLEGKSLERVVQEQNILPIETILPIYDQVCSALDHAHQNKIVHRDIKPANIIILQNGLVKLTDFGIAKMMSMGMTQAGHILGTPNYMSPEQVKGRPVDGRSDIFSLGIILYELLTGEKPFAGQNITTVIYKIINENPIPPRELDASIPAGLNYIVSKALAKNPDERYQTCREMAEDLRNYKDLGNTASPESTLVLKAPPADVWKPEPPPPAQPETPALTLDETPIASAVEAASTPPAPKRRRAIPQIAWVLGALAVVVILIGVAAARRPKHVAPLAPQAGRLQMDANIAGAHISIDGRTDPNWVTPHVIPDLAVGSHKVVVSHEGYATYQATATVVAGQTNRVLATLEPAPAPTAAAPSKPQPAAAPAPKVGTLVVHANIDGAKISLGGRTDPAWLTPFTISDLAAGTYNVVVSKEGYDDFMESVAVTSGQTVTVTAGLSQPVGEVSVITTPAGVEAVIDGKSYGPTPIHTSLPVGDHVVVLKPVGGEPYESKFKIANGTILTKKFVLGGAANNPAAQK